MTKEEAIKIVVEAADQWAGEYGCVVPDKATEVYRAIEILRS